MGKSSCGYCKQHLGQATVHCHGCGDVYHVSCFAERKNACLTCGVHASSEPSARPPIQKHAQRSSIWVGLAMGVVGCLAFQEVTRDVCNVPLPLKRPAVIGQSEETSELAELDPNLDGRVLSEGTNQATEVTFINQTSQMLRYYWLDFAGKRKLYGTLQPGATQWQQTYLNHIWLVENAAGQVMRVSQAGLKPGRITLVAKP